jgi:hypothetical protein
MTSDADDEAGDDVSLATLRLRGCNVNATPSRSKLSLADNIS